MIALLKLEARINTASSRIHRYTFKMESVSVKVYCKTFHLHAVKIQFIKVN